jgi:hypothetical protein
MRLVKYVPQRMKKAGMSIMVVLLLIATGGLSVTRHYCGRTFASFALYSTPEPCCGNDCDKCHNVFSFNKVTDNFTVSSSEEVKSPLSENLFSSIVIFELPATITTASSGDHIFHRKFLPPKTGDIPVSFGNFRC